MRTWEDFKNEAKQNGEITKNDLEEIEMLATIINAIINRRMELGISQRDLAEKCGLPQSSIARIEACTVQPKIGTLIKIMIPLGLELTANQVNL